MQRISLSLLILVAGCLATGPAYAGTCSNPAGNEGDQQYNLAYHTLQFCNGTSWIAEGAVSTGGGTLIGTLTASSSASLIFDSANSNWSSSYNTLYLNCAGLVAGTAGALLELLVGEGGGPTWENGAHYTQVWKGETSAPADTSGGSATASEVWATDALPTTVSASFKASIDNVSSSTLYKMVLATMIDHNNTLGKDVYYAGGGYWNNDTNPVTGLELVPTSGNIASGTCSLYGMN